LPKILREPRKKGLLFRGSWEAFFLKNLKKQVKGFSQKLFPKLFRKVWIKGFGHLFLPKKRLGVFP